MYDSVTQSEWVISVFDFGSENTTQLQHNHLTPPGHKDLH